LLSDDPGQAVVLAAESYADGAASRQALAAAEQRAYEAGERMLETMPDLAWKASPAWHAMWAAGSFTGAMSGRRPVSGVSYHVRQAVAWHTAPAPEQRAERGELMKREAARQWIIVRDIFGNPFRPAPPIEPSLLTWQDGLVPRLAEEAYQHRLLPSGHLDPERLGVLADALEEAGADAALVAHLREPGPHWRGCQVVDLITGRT
jgi:hypothetical protein